MKNLLLLCALFSGLPRTSMAQIMGKSVLYITTNMGTVFHPGDTLRLGMGTDVGGRFKYIMIPPNVFLSSAGTPLSSSFANQTAIVKELRSQRVSMNKAAAPRGLAVVNFGGFNNAVDLSSAEEAGEIRTRANRPKAATAPASLADELGKLKGLLDAGALTQAEYDTQKTRLLK